MVLLCVQSPTQNPYITAAVQVARPLLPADGLPTLKPDDLGMFSLADPDRVRRILTETGFHDIALDPLSLPMRLGGPGDAADAADFSIQFGPLTWALESIDGAAGGTDDEIRSLTATRPGPWWRSTSGLMIDLPRAGWIS